MPYKIALESGTHPAKSLNLLHQIVYSPSRLHTRTKRKTTSFQLPNLNGNSERVMMIEHLDLDLSIRFYEKFPYLYSSIRVYAYIYSEFIQEVMLLVDLSRTLRLFLQDSGGHAFKSLSNRKKRRRRMVLAILKMLRRHQHLKAKLQRLGRSSELIKSNRHSLVLKQHFAVAKAPVSVL